MSFAQLNLNPNIQKAIEVCGYTTPTLIQARSIPDIMNGRDLVACAQTGTGKTAAFVLPALHKLSLQKSQKTRVLILTPTRELANQITKAVGIYGKFLRFNIANLVGGMPYGPQLKDLARVPEVIVATPGRLMDHIESKRVNLAHVEILVLDEADRMLDMNFADDVQKIATLTPKNRQTLLFSATVDKEIQNIIRTLLKNPVQINLSHEKNTSPQIKQELYKANSPQHKLRLLKHILNDAHIFKAIIFSATKSNADKLASQLMDQGFSAAALHGDLRQNVRNRTIEQLRRGKIQFLVATDVAARGIDISDITHVINFDLPRFCEDYVHRIGRTGRAGKTGIAISFVLSSDFKHLQRIERFTGQRIKLIQHIELDASSQIEIEPREKSRYKSFNERETGNRENGNWESGNRERSAYSKNDYKPSYNSERRQNTRFKKSYATKEFSDNFKSSDKFKKSFSGKETGGDFKKPYHAKREANSSKDLYRTKGRTKDGVEGFKPYRTKDAVNEPVKSYRAKARIEGAKHYRAKNDLGPIKRTYHAKNDTDPSPKGYSRKEGEDGFKKSYRNKNDVEISHKVKQSSTRNRKSFDNAPHWSKDSSLTRTHKRVKVMIDKPAKIGN